MVIGIGYNGPARGVAHCDPCLRAEYGHGEGYDKCIAVHAEANAIVQSGGRAGCLGATLYIDSHNKPFSGTTKYNQSMGDFACNNCARLIINAGIEWYIHDEFGVPTAYCIPDLVKHGRLR